MPDNLGTHLQVTAVAVQAMQEATIEGPVSPIEAYRCNLHVLDSIGDSPHVTCMTMNDWHQAQWTDLVLILVIAGLQDGTLGQCQLKTTDPPELWQFLWECNHLKLRWGILYRKTLPKESQEALFQLVLLAAHRETVLKGFHNEVGHLGLECMLDLILLLLALHGCAGKTAHWQVPSMSHL